MEIVIENVQPDQVKRVVEFITKEVAPVLSATRVTVESRWVIVQGDADGAHVDELRPIITFHIYTLNDQAMHILTSAFDGTGFIFYAPAFDMRWAIA